MNNTQSMPTLHLRYHHVQKELVNPGKEGENYDYKSFKFNTIIWIIELIYMSI